MPSLAGLFNIFWPGLLRTLSAGIVMHLTVGKSQFKKLGLKSKSFQTSSVDRRSVCETFTGSSVQPQRPIEDLMSIPSGFGRRMTIRIISVGIKGHSTDDGFHSDDDAS